MQIKQCPVPVSFSLSIAADNNLTQPRNADGDETFIAVGDDGDDKLVID